ncbi:hypothetical protein, partial [Modestobacter marinus]|uniref:hypothetical protein n=1 Tax=Modestobacter marinus TaxID=477641 RepID=UPI001C93CA37
LSRRYFSKIPSITACGCLPSIETGLSPVVPISQSGLKSPALAVACCPDGGETSWSDCLNLSHCAKEEEYKLDTRIISLMTFISFGVITIPGIAFCVADKVFKSFKLFPPFVSKMNSRAINIGIATL